MTWMILVFFWPLILVGAAVVIYIVVLVAAEAKWRDGGHTRRWANFMQDSGSAGASFHEATLQLVARTEFARIRREASDKVATDPDFWMEAIDTAVRSAIERLAIYNPDAIPLLKDAFAGLSYGDILYPREAALVDAMMRGGRVLDLTEDEYAALRTVR